MKYKYLFFDLDGTIWDSREGITKSVAYALGKMGCEIPKDLSVFIGPPLVQAFSEYCGMTTEEGQETESYFQEYFTTKGVYENKLFPGVQEMLKKLREDGRILCTASSKPEKHILMTFQHFGIEKEFDYVCGGTLDGTRSSKEEVLRELLRRLGLTEEDCRTQILMIGDRKYDVEGAAAFGIPCLGTSMGFAAKGELETAGAVAVVHSFKEMTDYILAH